MTRYLFLYYKISFGLLSRDGVKEKEMQEKLIETRKRNKKPVGGGRERGKKKKREKITLIYALVY